MGSSAGLAAEYLELVGSVTDDPNLRIAGKAALFAAVGCQLLLTASQRLSPKMFVAYRRLKVHEQQYWDSLIPSMVHSVVVSAMCIWALCYSGDFFDTAATAAGSSYDSSGSSSGSSSSSSLPLVLRTSPLSFAVIGTSFGYFTMDALLLLLNPQLSTKEMMIHHAVALLSLVVAAQVSCMHVYLMMVLLTELTTPFVNLRWWLDKANLKHLKLYTLNGLMLLLVWGVARVMMFVPFYVHVLSNWSVIQTVPLHAIVLLLGVPLLLAVLNFMWFLKIARGAYKLVFNKQHRPKDAAGAGLSGGDKGSNRPHSSEVVSIQAFANAAAVEAGSDE